MRCRENIECHECQQNINILGRTCTLIARQIVDGMVKSGQRVAAHISRNDHRITVITIRLIDVPKVLMMDDSLDECFWEFHRDLQTGESLVIMTSEGSDHIGIYKLPPLALH